MKAAAHASLQKGKLAASILLCLCFGSIHAYGVLLGPIEQWLGLKRSMASLGYSTAILCLTAGVYIRGGWARAMSPRRMLVISGGLAMAGLALAASGAGAAALLVGYGAMFGLANGMCYSLSLSLSAEAMPAREGVGMGIATAAYGLGSVFASQVFATLLPVMPVGTVLLLLGGLLLLCCFGIALVLSPSVAETSNAAPEIPEARGSHSILLLWSIYFLGAYSGLMVIAHAAAISASLTGDTVGSSVAPALVAAGSVAGGFAGGVLASRAAPRLSLPLPLLVLAVALLSVLVATSAVSVLGGLLIVGLCYGTLISVVPAVIRAAWGEASSPKVFGKVFTAWGAAGLAGPLTAGMLFDLYGGYGAALALSAVFAILACALSVVR